MAPSASARSATQPYETRNSLSSKRPDASMEYPRGKERARIQKIRSRARKERESVRNLQVNCSAPSARLLLKQALQTFDLIDQFFFSKEVLRERRAPAQLSRWLDYADECLQAAVKQREFYETMLERYLLADTPLPERAGIAAKPARQQRLTSRASRRAGCQSTKPSGSHLKMPRQRQGGQTVARQVRP